MTQAFRARTSAHALDRNVPLTFIPADAPSGLPPVPSAGSAVPIQFEVHGPYLDARGFRETPLTIEAATRVQIVARLPDGRRYRMTPRSPIEPDSFWREGYGMSEWVVREALPAQSAPGPAEGPATGDHGGEAPDGAPRA